MKKLIQKIVDFFKRLFSHKSSSSSGSDSGNKSLKVAYTYGGLDFTKAKEDPSAVIGNLVVTNDAMRYTWVKGDLKGWGLADTDASAIAVFAVKDGSGNYKGGKFEWISKSRTSRAFTNIKGGYAGWPKNAVETAKGYAFCICSKDGKRRTNWITTNKKSKEVFHAGKTPLKLMDK